MESPTIRQHRRGFLQTLLAVSTVPLRRVAAQEKPATGSLKPEVGASGFHVRPGDHIQDALEAAARDPVKKTVYVHAGTYRPRAKGQALIWFNARHDGITLEG